MLKHRIVKKKQTSPTPTSGRRKWSGRFDFELENRFLGTGPHLLPHGLRTWILFTKVHEHWISNTIEMVTYSLKFYPPPPNNHSGSHGVNCTPNWTIKDAAKTDYFLHNHRCRLCSREKTGRCCGDYFPTVVHQEEDISITTRSGTGDNCNNTALPLHKFHHFDAIDAPKDWLGTYCVYQLVEIICYSKRNLNLRCI